MKITCIMCPVGCDLNVEKEGDKIKVTGNSCPRGIIYGEKEVTKPERVVTTIKKYKDRTISLKTDNPVDKEIVDKVLRAIKRCNAPENLKVGDILIPNIFGTEVNIVVTNIN